MRVLITVADTNGPGGIAHYYKALQGLFKESVDYMVIGSRYAGIRFPGPLRLISDYILFLFTVWKYDLIHFNPSFCRKCFFREAAFILIAKLFRKKTMVFFRGWEHPFEEQLETRWRWLFRMSFNQVDMMVVLAKEFEGKLRNWGYNGPISLETTTVDEKFLRGFDPLKREQKSNELNVLFLSRVEKDKGIFEAVDAIEQLCDKSVRFRVGGDGGARKDLEKYVDEKAYKCTEFCGYLRGNDKVRAYRQADVFILPSYHEGMPNSVLEAMAFGLPVITCPVGGLKDFFEDGKMGFLVPPKDTGAIYSALQKLLTDRDLLIQMSRYNAEYARNRFYSSRVVGRLEGIYQDVLSNERACS